MKKTLLLLAVICIPLSACMPAILQTPTAVINPPLISDADLQATVAISVEQTLQSLPTPTLAPSFTPVVMTATSTPTLTATSTSTILPTSTSTVTQNPSVLPTTATLSTGTITVAAGIVGTLPFTTTPNPAFSVTPTTTNHYQYYGTMPPNLPSGKIELINMSKAESYISLQCTTSDGFVTIIEYPVGRSSIKTGAPAGRYVYVAWVGGQKFTGNFKLSKLGDVTVVMYKDRVTIK